MNQNKKEYYRILGEQIVKKMQNRNMDAYYVDNIEAAGDKILELLGDAGKSVGYGGTMTIDDSNIKERIVSAGHKLVIREAAKTPEELKEVKAANINADAFLMSSNAVTMEGELVNVDGRGNRVAYLIYGPDSVIVVAGMNKVVKDVDAGIVRARNFAAPPNCVRLGINNPCTVAGRCCDCVKTSICSQIVITRTSMIPHRIRVILVGEELGY